ncbi:prolipoprotein diacylglyceryl transferase family protein [Qipengyuania flava]|uniref:prolipoprotein diacylglyceryl transferase family protein n=1 Tax=Qipengyuania flava TaxID=192812 RepID=UPI003BAE6666
MNGVVNLGPLALATDRLLAVVLLIGFLFAMDRILAREGKDAVPATGLAVIGGLFAARIAYILQHRDAFAYDWWSAFAVWQGGFSAWAGLAVAAAILAFRMRPLPAMGKGLAAVMVFGTVWFATSALLRPDPRPLPDLPQLARLSGESVTPNDLAGRPFVVNLWATWCPPCRRELPMLADVAANSDIPILLANQGENRQAVADYLLASGISPRSVVLDTQMTLMDVAGNGVLPTTVFVDARGKIVATHVGEISRAALSDKLQQLQGD